MRKSLAIILSAVLITAFAACGGTPSAPAESGQTTARLSSETTVNTETASTETTTVSENETTTAAGAETTAYLGKWSGEGVTVGGGHRVEYTIDIKSDGTMSVRAVSSMFEPGFKEFSRTYTTETLADGNIFIISKANEGDKDLQAEIALIYLTQDGKMYWTGSGGANKFTDKDGVTRGYPIDSSTPEFVKETDTAATAAGAETAAYLGKWKGTGVTVGGGHNVDYTIDIKPDGILSGRVILPMLDAGFKDFSRTYTTETLADGNIFIVSKAKEGDDLQDEIALIYLTQDGKMYWTLDSDSAPNKFTDKDGTTRSYPIDSSTAEFVKETDTAAAEDTAPLINSQFVPGTTATTTQDANFRSKPSAVDGELYYIIPKGAAVQILDSATSDWIKCAHNSKTGYILKSYISS